MNISAQQVKELREATGVGMMECKKALVESNGDMEKAIIWLREKGMARAAKKAGRAAAEGVVEFLITDSHKEAAIIELNCETDFAGKNEDFRKFARTVVQVALNKKVSDLDALKNSSLGQSNVEKTLVELISKVGENMSLRRVTYLHEPNGYIAGYSHMGGKIGTLIVLKGDVKDTEKAATVGNDLAMQIAASSPKYLNRDEVPESELNQEKEIIRKRMLEEGKPENIVEKAMVGQVAKYYQEVCLVDQPFIKEPKLTVEKYVAQSGLKASPTSFVRFQLGEGVVVEKTNFAEEVANQLK